jgi:hypothetical protein
MDYSVVEERDRSLYMYIYSQIFPHNFNTLQGISMGVASVISDYAPELPPLLVAQGEASKFLQLGGTPWRGEAEGAERLQV